MRAWFARLRLPAVAAVLAMLVGVSASVVTGTGQPAGPDKSANKAGEKARPIRIACVGDSITQFNTYQGHLQAMLDASYVLSGRRPAAYVVANFGVSGTTALDLSASYVKTPKYKEALAWAPDIVYIQLGTNDSRRGPTYDSIERFEKDYAALVKSFLDLPSRPKVYLADPPTMPNEGHWGDNDLNLVAGVIPRIHAVARQFGLPVIDQHTATGGHPEWVSDNVHPSSATAGRIMAAAIYEAITGLQPPATLYGPAWFTPTGSALANGDMERGPEGWAGLGVGTTLRVVAPPSDAGRGGTRALCATGGEGERGIVRDIKDALASGGPGDYFFEAWARLAEITGGSPTATVTITIKDGGAQRTFSTDAAGIHTATWTNLRAVKTIAWTGTLEAATLAVTVGKGCADPLLVDDVVLQKHPYAAPAGKVVAPSRLMAAPAGQGRIALAWTDNSNGWTPNDNTANETGFAVEWAADEGFTRKLGRKQADANATGCTVDGLEASETWYFRVRAVGKAGPSAWANVAAATAEGAPADPAAPTGLAATKVGDTQVSLSWKDNADGETGYRVEWAAGPDFATRCGSAVAAANATSHTVTSLWPSSTYAFRVRALGGAFDSAASNTVRKVTWRAVPNGTAARVAAVAEANNQARLTWADDCTNETGYVVQYATDATFTRDVGSVATKANATFCVVTGLKEGNAHFFRVRAVNALGSGDNIENPPIVEGAPSAVVSLAFPPAAPSDLAAHIHSSGRADLSWKDNSAGEDGFRIDRAADGDFTKDVVTATVPAGSTSYRAEGLEGEAEYYFRVRAAAGKLESANSPAVHIRTPKAGTPATASDLAAERTSSGEIRLSWKDNSDNETGFRIDQAADGGFTRELAALTVSAGATTHQAAGLKPATAYYFRVRAVNDRGESAPSGVASAATLPLPPKAPGPLTTAAIAEDRGIITWTDNSDNEEAFLVDRATDVAFTRDLVREKVAPDVISLTAAGLSPNTAYYFRIRAENIGGRSADSAVLEVRTPAASIPAAPGGLAGMAVSPNQVNLCWLDNSSNEVRFRINAAADASFSQRGRHVAVPADTTSWSIPSLTPAMTWHFRVRAVNKAGESPWSEPIQVVTPADELLAGEPFDGRPGEALNGRSSGRGWTGPWNANSDTFALADGSLSYADGRSAILASSGGRLLLAPDAKAYRQAARPTDVFPRKMAGGKPLDIWFSCLLRSGGGSRDFNPWSLETYNAGPQAQGDTSLPYAAFNAWTGGKEIRQAPAIQLQAGQGNLVICRYQVAADLRSFSWTWFINPADLADPLGSSTRTVWTASSEGGTLRGLDGFGIRCRTDANSTFEVDEIRYGDSVASVTPSLRALAAPADLRAVAASAHQIDLTWTDLADGEAGFRIGRATNAAFTKNLATTTIAANTTRYSASGLAAGTTYYFRIRAFHPACESANSPTATAATLPARSETP